MVLRVAVAIASYQHAPYVGAALESVLCQTRPPERIVVVDDGSTDGSREVLAGYARRGVEVLHQENAGAAAAYRRAVEHAADTDVVGLLDSDDLWHPERLARCLAALESDPDRPVVTTAYRLVDAAGTPLDPGASPERWRRLAWSFDPGARRSAGGGGDDASLDLARWLGHANFPATTSNVVARREALEATPLRAYRTVHDYHFFVHAAVCGRLQLLREPLLAKREHGRNVMATGGDATADRELVAMLLDLHADLAETLAADPAARERFAAFLSAAFENVSRLDPARVHALLARHLAGLGEAGRAALLEALPAAPAEERGRALRRAFAEGEPVTGRLDLARRLEHERGLAERESALLRAMLGSRWLALGRALGATAGIARTAPGKPVGDRLATLARRVAGSRWLALGQRLGARPIVEPPADAPPSPGATQRRTRRPRTWTRSST